MRLWAAKQWKSRRPDNATEVVVEPPVHGGGMLKLHNLATLLFWLACCVVLLDSHVPSWPLNKLLTKALTKKGAVAPTIPVWALTSLVYVGLWLLHWLSRALTDLLPARLSGLMSLARKEHRRAAEHFFPYGAQEGGQTACLEPPDLSAASSCIRMRSTCHQLLAVPQATSRSLPKATLNTTLQATLATLLQAASRICVCQLLVH